MLSLLIMDVMSPAAPARMDHLLFPHCRSAGPFVYLGTSSCEGAGRKYLPDVLHRVCADKHRAPHPQPQLPLLKLLRDFSSFLPLPSELDVGDLKRDLVQLKRNMIAPPRQSFSTIFLRLWTRASSSGAIRVLCSLCSFSLPQKALTPSSATRSERALRDSASLTPSLQSQGCLWHSSLLFSQQHLMEVCISQCVLSSSKRASLYLAQEVLILGFESLQPGRSLYGLIKALFVGGLRILLAVLTQR